MNGTPHTVKTDANGNYNYTFTAKKVGQNEIIVKYNENTKYNQTKPTQYLRNILPGK